jgi:hypothetical protein
LLVVLHGATFWPLTLRRATDCEGVLTTIGRRYRGGWMGEGEQRKSDSEELHNVYSVTKFR